MKKFWILREVIVMEHDTKYNEEWYKNIIAERKTQAIALAIIGFGILIFFVVGFIGAMLK